MSEPNPVRLGWAEIARQSFSVALPIIGGYIVLGIPCGILADAAGMSWWMVMVLSLVFYSGAGQFMIPNMYLAGNPLLAIVTSVSLVNTRQMLYAASLSQFCGGISRRLAVFFAATVTDESFGVNFGCFYNGGWDVRRAFAVNLWSQVSWAAANVLGVVVGQAVSVPTALASFAMTSLFICLLCMQKRSASNAVAVAVSVLAVMICKLVGLSGPAILIGALCGVAAAFAFSSSRSKGPEAPAASGESAELGKLGEPAVPEAPGEPGAPAVPGEPGAPGEPAQPAAPAEPAQPHRPAKGGEDR